MRALVVVVVALAGCGRLGFGASGGGAGNADTGDVAPIPDAADEITLTVLGAIDTLVSSYPVAGAYVLVDPTGVGSGTAQIVAMTDAMGHATIVAPPTTTLHVVYDVPGSDPAQWIVETMIGAQPGMNIVLGVDHARTCPRAR